MKEQKDREGRNNKDKDKKSLQLRKRTNQYLNYPKKDLVLCHSCQLKPHNRLKKLEKRHYLMRKMMKNLLFLRKKSRRNHYQQKQVEKAGYLMTMVIKILHLNQKLKHLCRKNKKRRIYLTMKTMFLFHQSHNLKNNRK